MTEIRIVDLPEDVNPSPSADFVPVDGVSTRRVLLSRFADAVRPIASQAEAEAGLSSTKVSTPQRVAQQTDARLASQAEAEAGDDDRKLMTPERTRQAIAVQAAQQTDARLASQAEAEAGDDDRKLMTPERTRQAIAVQASAHIQDHLPFIPAWENGVPGDGSDQTAALQALIDSLPNTASEFGGQILLKGDVRFTTLDLFQRRNIKFVGIGGNGTGSAQRTMLRSILGAGTAYTDRVIDARSSFNVAWENLLMGTLDNNFLGTFLAYGSQAPVPGEDAALMSIDDVYFDIKGQNAARGLWLYGATQGSFERATFAGNGVLVQMQNATGVGFCNVMQFRACNFKPTGTVTPAKGSGAGVSFIGCNVQASTGDGIGRFWDTHTDQPFRGVSLIGNTFYDALTGGGIWANFLRGQGLVLQGNVVGGAGLDVSNYGFQIGGGSGVSGDPGGVVGFSIMGNSFRFITAGVFFGGTIAGANHARRGVVGGNTAFGGAHSLVMAGTGQVEHVVVLPNYVHDRPNDIASHFAVLNPATHTDRAAAVAAGMTTGQIYIDTGSGRRLLGVV